MPVIGKLYFDINVAQESFNYTDPSRIVREGSGDIYASGTKDIIGTTIDYFVITTCKNGVFVTGGFTCFLPEGAIYIPVTSANPNSRPKAEKTIVRGESGNFLNCFGDAILEEKTPGIVSVKITFYSQDVYPLV